MRTRYICRVLCLVLCFSLFAQSVLAFETESPWVSFLDYDTGGVNGNYLTLTTEARLDYTLPFVVGARSFQGLFMYNGRQPTAVYVLREGSTNRYPCTVLNLGNGLCRFYLTSEANQLNDDGFSLLFVGEGTSTVINLLEFEFTEIRRTVYVATGSYSLLWFGRNGADYSASGSMSSWDSPIVHYFGEYDGQSNQSRSFNCFFNMTNWQRYDYLQFHIRAQADFITSISATLGDQPLPFELSYVNTASGSNIYGDIYAESSDIAEGQSSYYVTEGSYYFTEFNRNLLDITVTVDIRSCDRHSTYYPKIDLRGLCAQGDNYNFVELRYCSGIVEYDPVSPLYSFLRLFANGFSDSNELLAHIYDQNVIDHESIRGWFSEINLSITNFGSSIVDRLDKLLEREDTSESDQFDETLASQETVIDEMDAILDSVTKPDIEDIDTSLDEFVPAEDVQEYTGILRVILGSSILGTMCLMSLTLGLVSYIIYGKKG